MGLNKEVTIGGHKSNINKFDWSKAVSDNYKPELHKDCSNPPPIFPIVLDNELKIVSLTSVDLLSILDTTELSSLPNKNCISFAVSENPLIVEAKKIFLVVIEVLY